MKMRPLQFLFITLLFSCLLNAQVAPVIDGDTMLCPDDSGTVSIINGQTYETYQWYSKYWFVTDDFEPIPNATSSSFDYDWYTYDQSLFKVVVTIGDQTFESNTIQIDSYSWVGLAVLHEHSPNVTYDPYVSAFQICPGEQIISKVTAPYSICQWYKNGNPIEGATDTSYTITNIGEYYVVAAPDFCPTSTTNSFSIVVEERTDCSLSTDDFDMEETLTIYPNPTTNYLHVKMKSPVTKGDIRIVDVGGKIVYQNEFENTNKIKDIDVSFLTAGLYFIIVESYEAVQKKKFIKL